MKKVPLILQHEEKDCGAGSLAMVLEYYGKKLPLAIIREAIKVDQYGANIYGLLDGAEQFGLSAQAMEGSPSEAWEEMQRGDITFPVIARIVNRFGFEHYVVIRGIKHNRLYINDPGDGYIKLPYKVFQACFLGQIVTFYPTDAFQKENRKRGSMLRFIKMITCQKKLLFLIAILSLGVTAIGILGTFIFQYLIDNVLANTENTFPLYENYEFFLKLLGVIAILYLFRLIVQMLRGKLLTHMSRNIDLPLMLGYYNHVTELPMNFYDTRKTGEIISRFSDAAKIREAISGVTLTLMIDVVMVLFCGFVLYNRSQMLFSIAMGIFVIYLLISILYIKPLDTLNREVMEHNAQFSSYLKESFDGIETIKSSQAEQAAKEKARKLFTDFINGNIHVSLLSLSKTAIIEFVTSIGSLALLWIGAVNIINGTMTLGNLVTFITLLDYFLNPIQNLVEMQSSLQTAIVAANRLNDVLDLHTEEENGIVPENGIDSISFRDVVFRYGNRDTVLNGLTLSAAKGKRIALVGESGCGKSTAAKLLMGFYAPESGEVTINGVPVSNLSLKWLRSKTAYVPQNTVLFSDTVRNNLLLGLDRSQYPTDDEIHRILNACGCSFVDNLPFGLESMLEENGANLSGGQRQRLAIARALIRKPEILILDEATSALDAINESSVQEAIRVFFPEMTVLVIAHRLSTVTSCDKICVISDGQTAEIGNHGELLQKGGIYAELWKKQLGNR